MIYTVLDAIATANPPYTGSQSEAASFMEKVESLSPSIRKRIPALYDRSGIDQRYSCVEDYLTDPSRFTFFPQNWSLLPPPTTAERNKKYREAVIPLAETAARRALDAAMIDSGDITHVVAVSCTGFFAPGLDIELVKRLGMRADTQRTLIGFMGCYAAFNGLRVAHSFCQSVPDARVLLVCAELCTLHFQMEDSLENTIVNALFSDGAAAAVLSSRPEHVAHGKLYYADSHCQLDDDSMADMTWDIGDTGFRMGLSSRVPKVIAGAIPSFVDTLLGRNGLTVDEVDFWAIHPGGRAIVEEVQSVFDLSDDDVFDSLEVLRLFGNMSSPTILFVLERFLRRHNRAVSTGNAGLNAGIAVAFGPGLTLEGALFKRA